jgi:hypothetical protein
MQPDKESKPVLLGDWEEAIIHFKNSRYNIEHQRAYDQLIEHKYMGKDERVQFHYFDPKTDEWIWIPNLYLTAWGEKYYESLWNKMSPQDKGNHKPPGPGKRKGL